MTADTLRFMVVDDDALVRMTTGMLLRRISAGDVLEAEGGAEAMDMLRAPETGTIDIILCDLNMPGMDGMAFLRHLGEARVAASVLLVTSHDDALVAMVGKMARAYGVRFLGGLRKPLSPEILSAMVARHLSAVSAPRRAPSAPVPSFSLAEIAAGLHARAFEPFFQPKLDISTGGIRGAEALARWRHPEKGVLSPYAFIDTLENCGDNEGIMALTFLMLEQAAAASRRLHEGGYAVPVSVNLSLNLLDDPELADKLMQAVHAAGAGAESIVFEVTESAAMKDVAHSLENLARLRMHGFGLSIDDYGTGFANVQQLTRIPFGELKIDQSFVRGCGEQHDLQVIVRSSIELAHKLGMTCTAEGVETRQDWDSLRAMDCDVAQGYFIARPMDVTAFLRFCAEHDPAAFARGGAADVVPQ